MDDTNTLYVARLHLILFFWPAVLFCIAVYISQRYPEASLIALALVIFAFIWGFMVLMNYLYSSLTIKKQQVILRKGVLIRNTMDIPINKIESIDIRQTIFGTLLCYGTVVITGTGGTQQMVNYLSHPLTCRRYIEQLMHG